MKSPKNRRPAAIILSIAWTFLVFEQGGAQSPPIPSPHEVEKIFQYGGAEGQIGVARGEGDSNRSPESFAIAPDGTLYLGDLVNNRLLIYSVAGDLLRPISVQGYIINDLAVDHKGNVYVYDDARCVIAQLDASGLLLKELRVSRAAIDTRGYLHLAGSSFYFANSANKDVLIAILKDGELSPPPTNPPRSDGIHSDTGKIYAVDIERKQSLTVRVQNQPHDNLSITLNRLGIVSAAYVGEDNAGRFYIQTETSEREGIVLDVLIFNEKGTLLNTTRVSENDYAFWTSRLLAIRNDGGIVQFLPKNKHAKLRIVWSERNTKE